MAWYGETSFERSDNFFTEQLDMEGMHFLKLQGQKKIKRIWGQQSGNSLETWELHWPSRPLSYSVIVIRAKYSYIPLISSELCCWKYAIHVYFHYLCPLLTQNILL